MNENNNQSYQPRKFKMI